MLVVSVNPRTLSPRIKYLTLIEARRNKVWGRHSLASALYEVHGPLTPLSHNYLAVLFGSDCSIPQPIIPAMATQRITTKEKTLLDQDEVPKLGKSNITPAVPKFVPSLPVSTAAFKLANHCVTNH